MPNQSLVDLTERTATANTDLIHVNSGGSDYKQSKSDFMQGSFHIEFNNTSLLTQQVDALPSNVYVGYGNIQSYGYQTATGVPYNSNGIVIFRRYSTGTAEMEFHALGSSERSWIIKKVNGAWDSTWTQFPTRAEITSLNNSLTNSLALKITSTAPNLSNTVYSANSVKVMSVTAPTDINQLINVTIIGDYPSGSRQNLIAVSSWLYNGNVYVAIQNITSSSISATLQVQIWYRKSD